MKGVLAVWGRPSVRWSRAGGATSGGVDPRGRVSGGCGEGVGDGAQRVGGGVYVVLERQAALADVVGAGVVRVRAVVLRLDGIDLGQVLLGLCDRVVELGIAGLALVVVTLGLVEDVLGGVDGGGLDAAADVADGVVLRGVDGEERVRAERLAGGEDVGDGAFLAEGLVDGGCRPRAPRRGRARPARRPRCARPQLAARGRCAHARRVRLPCGLRPRRGGVPPRRAGRGGRRRPRSERAPWRSPRRRGRGARGGARGGCPAGCRS